MSLVPCRCHEESNTPQPDTQFYVSTVTPYPPTPSLPSVQCQNDNDRTALSDLFGSSLSPAMSLPEQVQEVGTLKPEAKAATRKRMGAERVKNMKEIFLKKMPRKKKNVKKKKTES